MEERIAQLEKEIAGLKREVSKVSTVERLIKLGTMIGAVCVFAWGLYQHFDTTRQEFRKTFWQEQYALYSEATKAAAAISIADDFDSVRTERSEFWSLYWGNLSIVESDTVYHAMIRYGEELARLEGCDSCHHGYGQLSALRDLSYSLARACRESLKKTWEPAPLDDIPERKALRH